MTVGMEKESSCDSSILKRLFISNLPSNVTEKKLLNLFPKNVEPFNVEIKQKNDSSGEMFAFVSVKGKEGAINACIRLLPTNHINGKYLSVQFAKQSFLERLKSERQSYKQKDDSATVALGASEDSNEHSLNICKPNKSLKVDEETFAEESSSTDSEGVYEPSTESSSKKLIKIEAAEKISPLRHKTKFQSNTLQDDGANSKKIKNIEEFSALNEETLPEENNLTKYQGKPNKGDLKRIESLEKRNQLYRNQASAIKNALKSAGPPVNKKVKFDYGEGDEESITEETTNNPEEDKIFSDVKKIKLFEDSDKEEEDEEEFNFDASKPMYKMVQTKYSTCDERFKLTDKFIQEEDDIKPEIVPVDEELENDLKIVDSILGKSILPKVKIKDKKISESLYVRYDPLISAHSKFVKKTDDKTTETEGKAEVKKKEKKVKIEKDSKNNVEKYYHISTSLADTFKSSNESFKLTDIFSSSNKESESNIKEDSETLLPDFVSNQFFSFSTEDDQLSVHEEDGEKNKNNEVDGSAITKEIVHQPLFFYPDDERLKESLDFFNTPLSEQKSFASHRSQLNKIVYAKIKRFNIQKNNAMFKKKLSFKKRAFMGKKKKK